MKFGRIIRDNNEEYGVVVNSNWYPISNFSRDTNGIEKFLDLPNLIKGELQAVCDINSETITWLPPIKRPGKIICVGRNYAAHSEEQGKQPETKPLLFTKYPTSMIGHMSKIPYPKHTQFLDYEVEIAVIMGKEANKLSEEDNPLDYVFGYTIANDLTARDVQQNEKQWTFGKGFDNSLPIGPLIITSDELQNPNDNEIWLTVNGDKRQLSNTTKMIFDIPFLIRYISQVITLQPGDIILTGTPEGVGYYMDPISTLNPGDYVSCGVSGIGELRFQITE
ncbi:MAG: fumarylacetoacetate hydrolase family protein [Candidatus Heimdallarchaeota archaeon]|nr:fumarylacetoacetate hydrolase family protein [Candidatus Heimdallarchaeota archaeon]MDH5647554.1 fumarylacetoacetate hydrolase family protein [Candidatus Heimdallarchaeota archaeon]